MSSYELFIPPLYMYLPTPLHKQDAMQCQFLSEVFPLVDRLPYQSKRAQSAGERIIEFIPFRKVLVLWEIQTVSSTLVYVYMCIHTQI